MSLLFYMKKKLKIINGGIYHINFDGSIGAEINKIHLAILYKIKGYSNMYFAISLTSPKEKHFKNKESFNTRNYLKMSNKSFEYIKQTDSIVTLDQIRMISFFRIAGEFKRENVHVIIEEDIRKTIEAKLLTYLENIFNK